ncbi:hypothetical protein DSB67_24045 [Vibrio campbellii]|nr:hypothetical protein DSB67_24045 [Vibrio campbellii]
MASKTASKAFKTDSPRLAFWVWVKFSVYGVQIERRGSLAHNFCEYKLSKRNAVTWTAFLY